MKISVDDTELFTLSAIQKKVIENDIPSEILDEDLKRRVQYILMHKYEQCMKRLREEWTPKLEGLGVESFPSNNDAFAELIFARPEYKNRSERELEA